VSNFSICIHFWQIIKKLDYAHDHFSNLFVFEWQKKIIKKYGKDHFSNLFITYVVHRKIIMHMSNMDDCI
jgi:hypothetical protein